MDKRISRTIINVKLNNLGRLGLLVTLLTLSALQLSAQSGGFSYLEFVENKGQWDSAVRFQSKMSAGRIYMQRKGFTILMEDTADLHRIGELLHGDFAMAGVTPPTGSSSGATGSTGVKSSGTTALTQATATVASRTSGLQPGTGGGGSSGGASGTGKELPGDWGSGRATDPFLLHMHSYRVSFVNANDNVSILPDKAISSYNNYMVGDKKKWTTHCKIYQSLLYKNLYNGIDVHYHTDVGTLKYDIVVHPGADLRQVVLQYDGQTSLSIRKNRVYIQTSVGTVDRGGCLNLLTPGRKMSTTADGIIPNSCWVEVEKWDTKLEKAA